MARSKNFTVIFGTIINGWFQKACLVMIYGVLVVMTCLSRRDCTQNPLDCLDLLANFPLTLITNFAKWALVFMLLLRLILNECRCRDTQPAWRLKFLLGLFIVNNGNLCFRNFIVRVTLVDISRWLLMPVIFISWFGSGDSDRLLKHFIRR